IEPTVGDKLFGSRRGGFDHADVVEQSFAGTVEQTKSQFVPQGWFTGLAGGSNTTPRERWPLRFGSFIAGLPRFGRGVIRPWIAQFEARAAAIGVFGPTAAIEITNL